jgi:LysM repeat protein
MKSCKIFFIVLIAHLLAVPIFIIQISRKTLNITEELTKDLSSEALPITQVSKVISLTSTITNQQSLKVHTVLQGENPSAIASKYGMGTLELMKLNGIRDARGLRVGDKLQVFIPKN